MVGWFVEEVVVEAEMEVVEVVAVEVEFPARGLYRTGSGGSSGSSDISDISDILVFGVRCLFA